ncbi:hypothetical protein HN51_027956 [Arachis hypogaea]|nr:uncharacterized protein DS421_9g266630 [Arachis hypogaea]
MSINRFSLYLLLLLLSTVSLNNSYGNIVTFKTPSINNEAIHPNINILFLSLVNDLPLGADPLFFTSNFRAVKYMAPGEHFTMITNFDIKWITLDRSRNYAPQCAFVSLYLPRYEGNHQKIY